VNLGRVSQQAKRKDHYVQSTAQEKQLSEIIVRQCWNELGPRRVLTTFFGESLQANPPEFYQLLLQLSLSRVLEIARGLLVRHEHYDAKHMDGGRRAVVGESPIVEAFLI
jgi:hypothetical protein